MQSGEKIAMAKKMRNFAAVLAISAVVGTMLLILVFLLPVGPMRRNVEKSVGDMLKTGDEIPEDAFSKYLWKNRETYPQFLLPWIIAVQHHSALHARFTFRILSVAAAAAITFIVLIVRNVKKCQKK